MKASYIGHSGFLLELEKQYFLFDYYQGEIPALNPEKELVVFVSHMHGDHYNHAIWKLKGQYPRVSYVISRDVPFSARQREKLGITEEDCRHVLRARALETFLWNPYEMNGITIHTFRSTDIGVAYLIEAEELLIYHAGDLNLWKWSGETAEYNQKMEKDYSAQLELIGQKVGSREIDLAFLPLDPRQKEDAFQGILEFLEKVPVKAFYPMHLWGKQEIVNEMQGRLPEDWKGKLLEYKLQG